MRVILGVTGSVATIKVLDLIAALKLFYGEPTIYLVTTSNASYFLDKSKLPLDVKVYQDADEWSNEDGYVRGDSVLHIELRKWADIMIVAPLDANTLAKIANGICDNLLTCILRAWDFTKKVYLAPAMNTMMWNHPITAQQLRTIEQWIFYQVIPPVVKTLVCGDKGIGAMASVDDIVQATLKI